MSELLKVSSNPHIRSKVTTSSIMTAVVIALLPAAGFGIYNFGPRALAVMAVTIASTVLTELLFGWLWKKKITISDMSAVVTGLLLALNLPVSIPLWMAALGGVFAILVVKMLFGGLGQNFMNPALAARCFLLISFPSQMTNFACDAYTGATPLAALKAGESVNVMNMIVGKTAGTIGETSVIALLIGACFLILIGVIDLQPRYRERKGGSERSEPAHGSRGLCHHRGFQRRGKVHPVQRHHRRLHRRRGQHRAGRAGHHF